jgi:hypothetical protein
VNTTPLTDLNAYLDQVIRRSIDPEERAQAENFLWDERPPQAGIDLYRSFVNTGPVKDLDDWTNRHRNYVSEHLEIAQDAMEAPWTFRAANDANRLRHIEPRLYLIRVEEASWPCSLSGISTTELGEQIQKFHAGDTGAKELLERFITTWNNKRDQRPQFATTELEVEEILISRDSDWAEQLRDRLGLGHYSPLPGGPPEEVLVLRYTVAEVLAAAGTGLGHPAIPTVLDSPLSCYFFPSPIPAPTAGDNPYYGHTVNLSPVASENAYQIGVELLHPRLDYRPEHLLRLGIIARPVTMRLEQARRFHLPWLQMASDRDDFGGTL